MTDKNHAFLTRRQLLGSASVLPVAGLWAAPVQAETTVDMAELLKAASPLGEMSLGPADAKVTVVEYASATCPHCAVFSNEVLPEFKKAYIDTNKVRYIFREFALDDLAKAAFMIARCAPQEKYFPLIEVLFRTQATWVQNPAESLKNIALQAGFTTDTFNACLQNVAVAKGLDDTKLAGAGFGIKGVPAFFINGTLHEGEATLEELKAKIDPLLG